MNRQFTKDIQMTDKHMKRYLTSFDTSKMQIKSTVIYHYIYQTIYKTNEHTNKQKSLTIPSASEDVDHVGLAHIVGGKVTGTVTLENSSADSYKVTHTPSKGPAITLLSSFPSEMQTCSYKHLPVNV